MFRSSNLLAALVVLAIVGGIFVMRGFSGGAANAEEQQPTAPVARGPLTISVSETGTVRPREQLIIKNQVEGSTTILYLIEEGAVVKQGELLIELDSSGLEDKLASQKISVINAEASHVTASENLEVVKNQAASDVDKAELDLEFAKQDLKKYEEGEYPKQLKETQARITLAQETLTSATNALSWSRKLHAEQYLSDTELEKDELAEKKATLDLELAREELTLLEQYTYKRQVAELTSAVSQAEMALERVTRKGSADIAQAEANLAAKEASLEQEREKLAKLEGQLTKTKITAPMDGTVIYASSTRTSWRGNDEPLDEGQTVRERQELIHLPTVSAFDAEVKVHEASLQKIRVGLPVRLTVEALPGQTFRGRVASIKPLPDPQSVWLNPDLKVYSTVIEIEGNGEGLRNGMSCDAEIVVEHHEDALQVPVQAVLSVRGRATAFVQQGGEPVARAVEIGLDNNRMVHVKSGLEVGEEVLLVPPLAAAEMEAAGPPPDMPIPAKPAEDESSDSEASNAEAEGEGEGERRGRGGEGRGSEGRGGEGRGGEGGSRRGGGMSEDMRERWKNMSDEEKQKLREQWRQGGGGGGREGRGQ